MIGQGNSLFSLYSRLNSSLCIPSGRVNVNPADFLLAALKWRFEVNPMVSRGKLTFSYRSREYDPSSVCCPVEVDP